MLSRALPLVLLLGCSRSPPGKAEAPPDREAAVALTPSAALIPAPKGVFGCHGHAIARAGSQAEWALPFELAACPLIPAVLGKVRFGMNAADVRAALGDRVAFAPGGESVGMVGTVVTGVADHPQPFRLTFDVHGLWTIEHFIDLDGFAALAAAWGEPRVSDAAGAPQWFNPATKIRVTARKQTWHRAGGDVPGYAVEYSAYSPIVDLFAPTGPLAAPILGRTLDEIAVAYPDQLRLPATAAPHPGADPAHDQAAKATLARMPTRPSYDPPTLAIRATEPDPVFTSVELVLTGEKVTEYDILYDYGLRPRLGPEILGLVAAALGTAPDPRSADPTHYAFPGPGHTTVEIRANGAHAWLIAVRAAR